MKLIFLISSLLIISSCKTTEELQREQMVDNLSIQMTQNQKLSAEAKIKLQTLEERLNSVNGVLEEQGHKVDKTYSSQMKQNQEKIALLEEIFQSSKAIQDGQAEKITNLEKQVADQQKYIRDVLKILKKVDRTVEDQKERSPYNQAFYDFNKGRYQQAKPVLITLSNDPQIKGNRKARILNALGMISYWAKKDDQCAVYFSKLITDYPKAPYTTNGLVYLAKSFKRIGEKEQAISALNMLIEKYPQSKKIPTAKALLKKYK